MANIMAVLLQSLSLKLGLVSGLDLAECCRVYYPWYIHIPLYVLCELAIIATDLAEVIGSAIALKLLFGLPIVWGVVITAADVFIILFAWNTKYLRYFEFFIMGLVLSCAICLLVLVGKSQPNWSQVGLGFIPTGSIFTNSEKLYIAIGKIDCFWIVIDSIFRNYWRYCDAA